MAGKVGNVVLEKAGHLAPFEDVKGCAEAGKEWLERWVTGWREEEQRERERRSRKSEGGDMRRVSEEWVKGVKGDPRTERPVEVRREKL